MRQILEADHESMAKPSFSHHQVPVVEILDILQLIPDSTQIPSEVLQCLKGILSEETSFDICIAEKNPSDAF